MRGNEENWSTYMKKSPDRNWVISALFEEKSEVLWGVIT